MRFQQNQGLFVQNRYNQTNTELNKTLNKLSSGYQINKASDDAAGLAISEKIRAQIRGLEQASKTIQDGISVINVMDAALGTMQSPILNRLRELIIQGANDTNTDPDRELIKKEINEIIEGIDDIVHNTEFNTIKPFIPPSEIVPGTPGGSGKADIVFVIDTTASMGSQIQTSKTISGTLFLH
ncbi:MAG: flagellin [Solibacillus sp.]|uniref:flagellin n=1 Tax=Solibacillus sp. TaxID=1909654 RepID=UPI003314F8D4